MIDIPWSGAETAFNDFLSSPIVMNAAQWIIGISIAGFALYMIFNAFSKR